MFQAPLPPEYVSLTDEEISDRIDCARKRLGKRLVILGHHYQRDETIRHADFRGDSYKLAKDGAAQTDAEYIIFCGVHFMAEAADILAGPGQKVILPNLSAGCSMADMASIHQVKRCWATLERMGIASEVLAITYINSAANLKAFVGEHGGSVCTSSNCAKVLEWSLAHAPRLLFFPDQHLGRNTALHMGFAEEQMVVWDPMAPGDFGGNTEEELRAAKFILWKGHCSVHGRFNVKQIEYARSRYPNIRVIVHPECRRDVVEAADDYGSTEKIVKVITESPAGSKWAVGTEINLVNRLAEEEARNDKLVFCLDPIVCPCSTMYRIDPRHLLWVLDNLEEGRVVNRIEVPVDIASGAIKALNRMLEIAA